MPTLKDHKQYVIRCFSFFLFACFARPAVWSAQTQPEARPLNPGQTIERDLSSGQNHVYQIKLDAGQFLEIAIEQRGIDLVATLTGPERKPLSRFDNDSRNRGQEIVAQVIDAAGDYRLTIEATQKGASPGQYAIQLTAPRPATSQDRTLQEARKLSDDVTRFFGAGRLDDALPIAQRVLALREQTLGAQHPEVATALDRLANVYRDKRNFAQAESLYLRAVAIAEKTPAPGHPELGGIFNDFGAYFLIKNDLIEAQAKLLRAQTVWEATLSPGHANLARAYTNLGRTYSQKGDPAKAKQVLQLALAIRERELGAESPQLLNTLINLGDIAYNHDADYVQAEIYFQRVLKLLEKGGRQETAGFANALGNIATIAGYKRDFTQAEALYRRAQAIFEKTSGPDHPDVAKVLNKLALLYVNQRDYAKAEPLHQRALTIRENALGAEHPDVVYTINSLARSYAAKGELSQAIATQTRAVTISERNLTRYLSFGSERDKLGFLTQLTWETDRTISLHARLAPKNADARRLSLTTILQRKGRALDTMTDQISALRRRATPADQELFKQLQSTRAELARLVISGRNQIKPDEYQKRIQTLEAERDKLETEVSRRSAEFRAQSQLVTLNAVQTALPKQAALIEFASYRAFNPAYTNVEEEFGPARYVAYVLHPQGEAMWVDLGEKQPIDRAVDRLRQALRDRKRQDVKRLARAVDRLVMQPIRPLLGRTRRAFIAPDAALNLIPFNALVDERGQYLLTRYTFSYLTSGRDLLRLQIKRTGKTNSQRALIFANPDFGDDAATGVASERLLRYRAGDTNEGTILTDAYFPALPGTDTEGQTLKSLLPEATLFTNQQANETVLKRVNAPSILHIATHGFFLDSQRLRQLGTRAISEESAAQTPFANPFLRSGLAMAGANQLKQTSSTQEDDSIFTALEAASLDLWGTQLVVLSACDSGVGVTSNGEGVYGLRRALVLAGSETQVMSLWPVSDTATRDLMIEYYRRLQQGEGRAEGLRQAQLKLLRHKQGQDRSHPYYWASFIQSGQSDSLSRD